MRGLLWNGHKHYKQGPSHTGLDENQGHNVKLESWEENSTWTEDKNVLQPELLKVGSSEEQHEHHGGLVG